MEKFQQVSNFIHRMVSDKRLRPTHIAILTALCNLWIENDLLPSYQICRKQVMRAAKIHSQATYHLTIRELQFLGYIHYSPSYSPKGGSMITLKKLSK